MPVQQEAGLFTLALPQLATPLGRGGILPPNRGYVGVNHPSFTPTFTITHPDPGFTPTFMSSMVAAQAGMESWGYLM